MLSAFDMYCGGKKRKKGKKRRGGGDLRGEKDGREFGLAYQIL